MTERSGILFSIAAPSGAGKTSLVKALLERDPLLNVSVSHTTRAPRPGEQNGKHYHFVSDTEFAALIDNAQMLEYANVFDAQYGTSKQALETPLDNGEDVLLDIDWQGAEQVQQLFPADSVGIFLLPPSTAALKHRLESRAQDHPEVIAKRMAAAQDEMSHYPAFDYLVVNDDFEQTVEQCLSIVAAERVRLSRQEAVHADLLHELLA